MRKSILGIFLLIVMPVIAACNLPSNAETDTPTPAPLIETASTTSIPVVATDTPTPAPLDPLVLRATLCWKGPGPTYEVVSALNQGSRVKLLGQGSISGWYIVDNPIYHDPCWVQQSDLQIEPGTDLLSLQTFNPPPTYTPTKPPPTSTPTATPTP